MGKRASVHLKAGLVSSAHLHPRETVDMFALKRSDASATNVQETEW